MKYVCQNGDQPEVTLGALSSGMPGNTDGELALLHDFNCFMLTNKLSEYLELCCYPVKVITLLGSDIDEANVLVSS